MAGSFRRCCERLDTYWRRRNEALDERAADSSAPVAFAACVGEGLADAVVFYDAWGRVLYPAPSLAMPDPPGKNAAWAEAERLEHVENDPAAAAAAYAAVAAATNDDSLAAQSLQAQARCLVKAGETAEAIRVLTEELGRARYAGSLDAQGRLIAADAQLRALELIDDREGRRVEAVSKKLIDYLDNYNAPSRRPNGDFLRRNSYDLRTSRGLSNTEGGRTGGGVRGIRPTPAEASLQPAGLPGRLAVRLAERARGRPVREETLLKRMTDFLGAHRLSQDARIDIVPPGAETDGRIDRVVPAGEAMPGWRLTLALRDDGEPDTAVNHRIAMNVWIAALVIVSMSIVAVFIAVALRRQMRLTRLRNDLLPRYPTN